MKKPFPVDRLEVKQAEFEAVLEFNPYADRLPPSLLWRGGIGLEKIDLGDSAADAEIFGSVLDTWFSLDGIHIPERRWTHLAGPYVQDHPYCGSSIYVCDAHNPVAVVEIGFSSREGTMFEMAVDLEINFDIEGTPYENIGLCINSIEAKFTGLVFHVPIWNEPADVEFPPEWKIPDEYTQDSVDEMMSRFVDLDLYNKVHNDGEFKYTPI